ncbi:MAG: FAD-dependent oxidoreductase, partial [Candidatus Omnitrophica bacterium]|nr:FAD-dependent oxidoreductase [Candidatus Omnitrophota bacterium]
MPKIVIIGNSAAGFACCDTLAKLSSSNEITVISKDKFLPYRKDNLLEYISGRMAEHALFLVPKDYYSAEKIDYRPEQEVSRLDTKRQRVILKDNSKISYDYLVIASGQQPELPDIPGTSKDGVIAFSGLEEAKTIIDKLLVVNLICCVGKADPCLKLAKVLLDKGKEVKAIISDTCTDPMQHEKLEVISNAQPIEIIGEGTELKALKLSNGKVIGTSMIIFTSLQLPSSA